MRAKKLSESAAGGRHCGVALSPYPPTPRMGYFAVVDLWFSALPLNGRNQGQVSLKIKTIMKQWQRVHQVCLLSGALSSVWVLSTRWQKWSSRSPLRGSAQVPYFLTLAGLTAVCLDTPLGLLHFGSPGSTGKHSRSLKSTYYCSVI